MISFLILEVGMLGVFLALDTFLFYIFWSRARPDVPDHRDLGRREPDLRDDQVRPVHARRLTADARGDPRHGVRLPGRARRRVGGAFDFEALKAYAGTTGFADGLQLLSFGAFFLAFAIKVPMFPFHTWLPDAHVEAPTAGSVILAGVLLKLGGYGFIRFSLSLYPDASHTYAPLIIVLSLDRDHLRRDRGDGPAGPEEAGRLLVGAATWASSRSESSCSRSRRSTGRSSR
jgi:NADH-quinone oxidoreductase subunit M